MASFNRVILVGRLTRDPEIKYTPQGTQLAKFGLAVNRVRSKTDQTDFFNITAWQRLAEICGQYLRKGKLVLIEGEIQTRRYETQDGQRRTAWEIIAQNMQMLDRAPSPEYAPERAPAASTAPPRNAKSTQSEEIEIDEIDVDEFDTEDMPF